MTTFPIRNTLRFVAIYKNNKPALARMRVDELEWQYRILAASDHLLGPRHLLPAKNTYIERNHKTVQVFEDEQEARTWLFGKHKAYYQKLLKEKNRAELLAGDILILPSGGQERLNDDQPL